MKTLFLHIPKFNNFYKPIGDFIWLNYMPMGLLAIVDFADRHGHSVELVHLGVEWIENKNFRVDELVINQQEIQAIGMTLHWHHQAYDVIEVARRIKAIRKDIFIFLGGDTASFFHKEIIQDYPMIDAVVRGYGENPVVSLLEALRDKKGLDQVQNLTWRNRKSVQQNELVYTSDANIISGLNYTNFSLLRHADTYIRYTGLPFFFAKGFTKETNFRLFTLQISSISCSYWTWMPIYLLMVQWVTRSSTTPYKRAQGVYLPQS